MKKSDSASPWAIVSGMESPTRICCSSNQTLTPWATRSAASFRTNGLSLVLCARFYAEKLGRPGLGPGIYFRSLMIGYFEGIEAERGIAWRLKDSLSLRRFLGIALDEDTPDHSTISRTRRLIDVETHQEVFAWVL